MKKKIYVQYTKHVLLFRIYHRIRRYHKFPTEQVSKKFKLSLRKLKYLPLTATFYNKPWETRLIRNST